MRIWIVAALLAFGIDRASAAPPPEIETLCAGNPAYAPGIMRSIVESELAKDHDPSLDAAPPDKIAEDAEAQGISECAADLRRDPATFGTLKGLKGADITVGWDAYNTTCADRAASKGDCIRNEVGAQHALRHMSQADDPPGVRALVQTCELVMQTNPAMTEWRQCVDIGLAVHAPIKAAQKCRVSVSWHTAKSGAEAGRIVAGCLRSG
jgi:hypothetical protein